MGLALNEVGAEPVASLYSIERFHHEMKGGKRSNSLMRYRYVGPIPSEARMRGEHACIRLHRSAAGTVECLAAGERQMNRPMSNFE